MQRDAARAPGGRRARLPSLTPLSGRPDARLRQDMAAYAQEHDVRGLMDALAQSLLLRMPRDPRSFLAAELARHRPLPADSALPLPRGTFVLRLHAAVDRGGGTTRPTSISVRRVLSRSGPRGHMATLQAERDVAEQVHALLWSSDTAEHRASEAADGGEHQQRIQELEQLLAEAKRQAQLHQAPARDPVAQARLAAAAGRADKAETNAQIAAAAGAAGRPGRELAASKGGGATTQKGTQDVGRTLEDCTASRATSDLELALRAQRPESVLAAAFPPGTMLKDLGTMSPDQLAAVVDQSHGALVQLLVGLGAQMTAVAAAEQAAQGSKFNAELKGGTLDDFYQGVTGICGPPSADIEKGMEEEHTQRDDSRVKFSTPNYGLQTDPSTEYQLVVSGGAGCAKAPGGTEEGVVVTGTRGCCKGGETQPDVRVLRPIEYYGDFGADGRLKDPLPRDSDTPMRRRVKMAGLWRFEVFALVLYSGERLCVVRELT